MAVEMGAKNGIIEADEKTRNLLGREGRIFKSDKDAVYEDEYEIEVDRIGDCDLVEINFETGQIHDKTKDIVLKAKPMPKFIQKIVEKGRLSKLSSKRWICIK